MGILELKEGVVPAFHCSLIGGLERGESVPHGGNGLELYRGTTGHEMHACQERRSRRAVITGGWSTDDARGREGN
jgi:hypothetical protein